MSENNIPLNEINYQKKENKENSVLENNFEYLNKIKITNYFFLTHKNVQYIFYIYSTFSALFLIFAFVIFKIKAIYIFFFFSIGFYIISIFPYGINVKLNKDEKTIELEKKCMIQKFSFSKNIKFSLYDINEFAIYKKDINHIFSGLKINLVLMSGRNITLYEEWVLKEDENEIFEKTKKLNEFVNKE